MGKDKRKRDDSSSDSSDSDESSHKKHKKDKKDKKDKKSKEVQFQYVCAFASSFLAIMVAFAEKTQT